MSEQILFNVGMILIFAGFLITLIAIVLMFFIGIRGKGKVRGGGAVIIGPFPIIFGTDKESVKTLLLLSIILIILLLIVTVFYNLVLR
ncbi:hypothetical protein DRO69_01090 [Candidatus Bathyarchaeota archaeon]|nr:MAG: hypothetical protein DRO69_01090 [Candidatus Bathyarchaeota archaeon]